MSVAVLSPFQLRLRRGIERYVSTLSSALARQGVQVDVLTWDGPEWWDALATPGVRVLAAPRCRYYQPWAAVPVHAWRMWRHRYDHVLAFFADYGEGPLLRVASGLWGQPFSVVLHFPRSLVPHRYDGFRRWGLDRRAEQIVAVSRSVAEQAEAWSARSCLVLGHGVDTEHFRPDPVLRREMREKLGLSEDALVLVTAATLEERKGVQWVIKSLPAVSQAAGDVHYLVLGDGPYRPALEQLTASLCVSACVLFAGTVNNVEDYLAAADVALLLSYGEASPVALLEYLAAALPALVARHPPFDESTDDAWGRQVCEEDTDEVADAIISLAEGTKRREMGKAARKYVQEHHRWEDVAARYIEVLGL